MFMSVTNGGLELNQPTMIQYLLGELPPAAQERLEEQFFTDQKSLEKLKRVEDQLVDDYVSGVLSPRQREQFESHYLNSDRRRAKLQFARTLKQTLIDDAPSVVEPVRLSLWQSLLQAWHTPALRYSFAGLTVAAAIVGSWLYREARYLQQQREQLAVERAALAIPTVPPVPTPTASTVPTAKPAVISPPPQPSRRVNKATAILTFLLTPNRFRNDDMTAGAASLIVTPQTKFIHLKLLLKSQSSYPAYRIALETADGKLLKTQGNLKPVQTGQERYIVLPLTAQSLSANDYLLTLAGKNATAYEEVADYQFRIVKQP